MEDWQSAHNRRLGDVGGGKVRVVLLGHAGVSVPAVDVMCMM